MNILGISAFYHDSAACLVRDGEIVAAAQEERFTRKKHDASFPSNAVSFCLNQAGLKMSDVGQVVFYEKPFLKFERLLETYLSTAPGGVASFLKAIPLWIKEKLWTEDLIRKDLGGYQGQMLFPRHHESHAASAFYPSPFEEAAILTMDGVGEWTTSSIGEGRGNRVKLLKEIRFPHSLGLLYSAFTYYIGFRVNSGEYKVMGLAPYGEPIYKDLILKELLDLREDGSFRLNMRYFNYCAGLTMTHPRFHKLFGGEPRKPETKLTQRHMDLARSVQAVTEEVMVRMARYAKKLTGLPHLCLAGGVALNCVGNGKILREGIFDRIWVQPASGDAGGALGAALLAWYQYLGNKRQTTGLPDFQKGSFLGPEFSSAEIEKRLTALEATFTTVSDGDLPGKVAELIASEKVIGWFQGRMEFGPRALGARSILGDARSAKMQEVMNLKIKFRESFRPFAPSVLRERLPDFFEADTDSPYMLFTVPVKEALRRTVPDEEKNLSGIAKLKVIRSPIPAVTHVDYSARIQTVDGGRNALYHSLLKRFDEKYDCPVIINTSFNVRGEPMVCTPEEAYVCFMRTNMDVLVIGNCLLLKENQKAFADKADWIKSFELD